MSDRYHLCLPTIEPLAKVIDLATPLERDDHQQPENFDIGRVQSVLAPNAMVAHNIKQTLEAAVVLQRRAAASISTAKKHKKQELEALKETQMVKAFSSEKKVLDQLCDFITDQKEQAVNMYVCVCDYVISFYDWKRFAFEYITVSVLYSQACNSPSTKKPRRGVGSEAVNEHQLHGVIEHKTVYTGPSDGRIGRETPKCPIAAARFH